MVAKPAHTRNAEPGVAEGKTVRKRDSLRRTARPVRVQVEALLAAGASEQQIAKRTRLSRAEIQPYVRAFEREQDLRFAALVRQGVVSAPELPKEPLPAPLTIEGGLSATVLSDRG